MSNAHQEKFLTKLLLGIIFITAGIFVILYASFEKDHKQDWYFWGILASLIINAGLFSLGNAFIHKMKSDLIRRQKQREQQKTFTAD